MAATSRTETGADDATHARLLAEEAGRALNSLRRQALSPTTSLQRAVDSSPLRYNRADPYPSDLVVCRPEPARPLVSANAGSEVRR